MKKLLLFIAAILSPVLLSVVFILAGSPDENGRISLTGETTSTPDGYQELICESQEAIAASANATLGGEAPQDAGSGCEPTDKEAAQLGASAYYRVDVLTPTAFYNAVNGVGFNEGYGYQCVAGFKEFMFSLSGKYVATKTGAASGYATQQTQIEPLGFTWHAGTSGLQDGDWGIFGGSTYGHVAMYYQGKWFGQNQGAANGSVGNAFNLRDIGNSNLIGYYRPNIYIKKVVVDTGNPGNSGSAGQPVISNSYTVTKGDTLGGIALKQGWYSGTSGLYGTSGYTQRLAESNGIAWRGLIYPNQVINKVD